MVLWFVLFCHLMAFSDGAVVHTACFADNDVLDSALNQSNAIVNGSYKNTEYEDGFKLELPVYFLGVRLPWTVSFEVSVGSMKPLASLSRSGDAVHCSTPITRTLEVELKYDNIIFSYDTMTAKFLFLEMTGSFTYNVGPIKLDVAIAEGFTLGTPQGPTCSLEAFKIVSTGTKNFEITSNSWYLSIFKKLIGDSLLDDNTTPILDDLVQTSTYNIHEYFAQTWCDTVWHFLD